MYVKVTNIEDAVAVLVESDGYQVTDSGWILFVNYEQVGFSNQVVLAIPSTGFYWTELTETQYNELASTVEVNYTEEDTDEQLSVR